MRIVACSGSVAAGYLRVPIGSGGGGLKGGGVAVVESAARCEKYQ